MSLELETPVTWEPSGDPLRPYRATVSGNAWEVRVNDFPEEPLYTLFVAGAERLDFNDWPARWARPAE